MKIRNNYYTSFTPNDKRIDDLKYGLTNDLGYNLYNIEKEEYNEDKIIKIK